MPRFSLRTLVCCSSPSAEGDSSKPLKDANKKKISESNTHSEVLQTALGGVTVALKVAEQVVDGFPIPGAKLAIGAVLNVIERIKVTSCTLNWQAKI